ncbi:hypothetical protein RND81_04G229200 [Saponaria officinalis]|uniref:Protein kinase domain-containing protein n=1 Tax=Saponaria officinalis TaxID=3572 RepID=A0AAW1LQG8_SAPOF
MGQVLPKNKNKHKIIEKFESKEKYFIKNGGILLDKQMSLCKGQNITCPTKIVTQEEIKHATNSYDPQLIIARLRDANVYKGTFNDRGVIIKTPKQLDLNPELVDLFLTEASVAMVISHENMNKIFGCCLETYIPMIVYDDIKKRGITLYLILHGEIQLEKPFKWAGRLRGATDIAYALSYMHNALSKPLVHRDVKSIAILIDSSFHAKLVNIAYSVSINPGKKEQRWPVYGAPGYIDPEYKETRELTDKCDVYSFGVLMLELITGMNPSEMVKSGKDLVGEFVSKAERNGGIKEMIDMNVVEEEGNLEEIQRFARLALQCVAKKGDERPTMIGVVEELWRIQEGRNDQQ